MAALNNWKKNDHPGISRPWRDLPCCYRYRRLVHCAGDEMTDRELLEAAAKAAGMPAFASGATGLRVSHDGVRSGYIWNPLTDDGDALRLAVKLRMDICRPTAVHNGVAIWLDHASDFIEEPHGKDPYAATRRAIVRAAAEIGKSINP